MVIYTVTNGTDFNETFYNLSSAKKAMKEHNAKGYKTKVYSNGEWVNCGEINLTNSNKSFIANSPRNMTEKIY